MMRRWGEVLALPENRSALRAARGLAIALAKRQRPPAVPLVLHGPPGGGKSLLAGELLRQLAEGATGRIVAAGDLARLTHDEDPGFADPELAACDLLVLEDVQHLPARAADAVGALLDRRTAHEQATVLTANAGPAALRHLPRKLTSRFAAGLVVRVDAPGPASRRALLADAAAKHSLRLTDAALDWLVRQAAGTRMLLGFVQTLAPAAREHPGPLDGAAVEAILAGTGLPNMSGPDVSRIVKRVAKAFGVTGRELLGPSRLRRVLRPRQVAMYLTREVCGWSFPRIGVAFGRDHTTVMHAVVRVEEELSDDDVLAATINELRSMLT